MSFLKSLFSPSMQRETVIEHLIETLSKRADPCEWVQVLNFEQLQEYMTKKSATVIVDGDPYPNESVVYHVWIGANDYDVSVSRAFASRGVLITSKLAGTDDYSEIRARKAKAAQDKASEDDAVIDALNLSFEMDRPVIVPPLSGRALRQFFESHSVTKPPEWLVREEVIHGAALCNVPSRGLCLVMVGRSLSKSYMSASEVPPDFVNADKLSEAETSIANMMPRWGETLVSLELSDIEFDIRTSD